MYVHINFIKLASFSYKANSSTVSFFVITFNIDSNSLFSLWLELGMLILLDKVQIMMYYILSFNSSTVHCLLYTLVYVEYLYIFLSLCSCIQELTFL